MPSNNYFKTCRYDNCKHESKMIDIRTDQYVCKNSRYYHKDCYKAKTECEWKTEQQKCDLQLFKLLWTQNINRQVNFGELCYVFNQFLSKGISSDYILFALQYCINNHYSLHYPAGFKYYIDRQEIKKAYENKQIDKIRANKDSFVAVDKNDAPKFSVNKKKTGFQSILGK